MTPKNPWILATVVSFIALSLGIGIGVYAQTAPAPSWPLYYSGAIEAEGKAPSGTYAFTIDVWDKEVDGTQQCTRTDPEVKVENGRFRVDLTSCADKIRGLRDAYVQVKFTGPDSIPREIAKRAKVGVVPFALEAEHAAIAAASMRLSNGTAAQDETVIDAQGRLGIGVAQPAERLHVNGKVVADPTYAVATTTKQLSTTSSSFVAVPELSVRVATHGKPVLITANLNFNGITASASSAWGVLTVYRDGVNLGGADGGLQIGEAHQNGGQDALAIVFVDTPGAGDHTYTVYMRLGGGDSVEIGQAGATRRLAVMELN